MEKNTNKATLLIDGNYFVYSRLYVLPRPRKIPGLENQEIFMESEDDLAMFMRKLSTDLASTLRKMTDICDEIVLCYDSKSWRKTELPDSGYKSNREQDDKIYWKNVAKGMDDFANILSKQGVKYSKIHMAEGDDLIYAWSKILNSTYKDAIIFSGDKDLIQLVYKSKKDSITTWYDPTRKLLAVYNDFVKDLEKDQGDDFDLFSPDSNSVLHESHLEHLDKFAKSEKLKVEEINAPLFILEKILTGDKSDNIKSVYLKPSKTGTRYFKVNKNKSRNIVNVLKSRHDDIKISTLLDEDFQIEICRLVEREMKVTGKIKKIHKNLKRNMDLMLLDYRIIPKKIFKSMFNEISKIHKQDSEIDYKSLTSMESILNDTDYIKEKSEDNDMPSGAIGGLF